MPQTDAPQDPGCLDDGTDTSIPLSPPKVPLSPPDFDSILETTHINDLRSSIQFIQALQMASHDDIYSGINKETLYRLRNPPTERFMIDKNPDLRMSFELFLNLLKSSIDSYKKTRDAILRRHPDDGIPSHDQMKKILAEVTGVGSVVHPMCKHSCMAYTRPLSKLDKCLKCGKPKLCPVTGKPQQEFHTILIGPVLQALWRDPSSAQRFSYRRHKTSAILAELRENMGHLAAYDDFFHGTEYLENIKNGNIRDDDIVLMFSIDGAQLYAHKVSDCWIYIWVVMDISPDERYKKGCVLPGGFIPGPNKPKIIDSYLFPGLHHLAALQREGLKIWDASKNRLFISRPFLALVTADGPAMVYLNALVGHQGKFGCRLYCPAPGRHKPNGPVYYPALLKPIGYVMQGCDHPDISHFMPLVSSSAQYFANLMFLLESPNDTQYKKRRLRTGITKATIFLGLPSNHILNIPGCFGSDIMHLASFNIGDLFLPLWCGVFDHDHEDPTSSWPWAVLTGQVWEAHGSAVAAATPYLPGSFDRPPRNIAEKINSGYKAWEWLLYLYGLAPALLYGVLPMVYYTHFCKLVRGMRIIQQHRIRTLDLIVAQQMLLSFAHEFELLYYQRRTDRIHFCRQSVHALLHLANEVIRIGPPICSSQWTMERTIGNLGEEIRQPSKPYANLSQRGLIRNQVNALTAMVPDLVPPPPDLPRGAVDLGRGYVLLRAQDRYSRAMDFHESKALENYLRGELVYASGSSARGLGAVRPAVTRWARLRLPNGQVA